MKIALLTFWAADNYGATLQAYATIKAFEHCGHEVELVNYVIPEPPRSFLKNLMLYPKHLKFEHFRKKYFHHLTRPYKSFDELKAFPPKADCYLVGSDQTWNPDISVHMAKGFFLDFGTEKTLKASYAASFGKDLWEDTEWIREADAKKALARFDFVSVRETSGVHILKNTFGIDAVTQVLDPVLLFEGYPELVGNVACSDEILLYKLVNSQEFYHKCRMIGTQLHLPLRSIGSIRQMKGIRCAYPESLEGWLQRIAGAKYVITDSFHGTVISLLYRQQFVSCVGDPKRVTRLKSLLEILGLGDRLMKDSDDASAILEKLREPIDYDGVQKKLKELRHDSFDYIFKIEQ